MGYYSRDSAGIKFESSRQLAAEGDIDPYQSRMLRTEPSLADVIIEGQLHALLVFAFALHVAEQGTTAIESVRVFMRRARSVGRAS
jgi:hypothetical protein